LDSNQNYDDYLFFISKEVYKESVNESKPNEKVDTRHQASFASCSQNIAQDSAVTFSMFANIENSIKVNGSNSYKLLHTYAGLIGQLIYVMSEYFQIGTTGMGCFLEDAAKESRSGIWFDYDPVFEEEQKNKRRVNRTQGDDEKPIAIAITDVQSGAEFSYQIINNET